MTADDIPAVAEIRVRGWQAAYAGIVPGSYLDAMDPAQDADRRRQALAAGSGGRVRNLVAEDADGTVTGWAAFGPYRGLPDGTRDGELYALYVRPERIGTGLGSALTAAVLADSARLGRARLLLWVLEANARARRFYTAAGFAPDGAHTSDTYDGVEVREMRYVRELGG